MAQGSDVAQATPDLGRHRKVLIDMSSDEVRQVKCLLLSGPMDTVQDAVSQVKAGLRRTARTDVPELTELEIFEPDFSTWVDFDDIALLPEGSKRQLRRKQAPLAAASPLGGGSAFAPEAIARRAKLKRGCVVAKVGYKVENVGEIDCHKSVFFASVKVFLQWNEPELAQCTEEEIERLEDAPGWKGMTAKHSNPLWEKLHFFHPDLQVLNLHTHLRCSSAIQVKDKQKGTVKMAMYICDWLELDVGGALRNFPFDYHDLRLSLRSHKLNTGSLRLAKWSGMHTAEFQEQQNEWQLAGHRGDLVETDPNTSSTGKTYHEFHVVVMVRRYYSWYVWNVGIYMMALFAMSMAMYMMPVENIGDRAETSVALSKFARAPCVCFRLPCVGPWPALTLPLTQPTAAAAAAACPAVLAIIATKFVVADHIPRCSFVTFFDSYVLACFAFNTFAGAESIAVYRVSLTHPDLAKDMNEICSVAIPCSYFVFHLYLLRRFRKHFKAHAIWMTSAADAADDAASGGFEKKQRSMKTLNKRELLLLAQAGSFRGKKAIQSPPTTPRVQSAKQQRNLAIDGYNARLPRLPPRTVKVAPAPTPAKAPAPALAPAPVPNRNVDGDAQPLAVSGII